MKPAPVYLDCINGAPLREEAAEAMRRALEAWGNPASGHREGRAAAQLREKGRGQAAGLIGAQPSELFFASSATEANSWALTGLAEAARRKGDHLVISAVEHLSVIHTARRLEKAGWRVTAVPVDGAGQVDVGALEEALTDRTVGVSIQWANGEVGTIQPVADWVSRVKARGIWVHADGTAAAGQIPLNVREIPVDALSFSAHPLGGPAGIGALYLRKGVRIEPLLLGGGQEEGRRAGTENLVGIAGFGAACEAAARALKAESGNPAAFRDETADRLTRLFPAGRINGAGAPRLPRLISFSLDGMDGEQWVGALDLAGVSVGLGSACSTGRIKASHVLRAMGVAERAALGTILISWDRRTDPAALKIFLERLPQAVDNVRAAAGQTASSIKE